MTIDYSVQTIRLLEAVFQRQKIIRPMRIHRYDPGSKLTYKIRGVVPARVAQAKLEVEKFVGGGYAGQVYRVKLLDIGQGEGPIQGLQSGQSYALKILIPPTGFARWYRNMIYALAFQGPFSLQVNPAAARAGAIWQKLIRCGALLRLGSEKAVVDILATFVDPILGSCGEISEWVEGRMWRLEVDDNLDARLKWKGRDSDEGLGSPEYRAKKSFMSHLVELMHEMGALELARQYEWWTCKSQPNVLKRTASDPSPTKGLVAVDFRAGLALLPFLPMCPADFKLIVQGVARGSLVQFDRGHIDKMQHFVREHPEAFAGTEEAVEELKQAEKSYRDSLPDVAHRHLRLFSSRKLWSSILASNILSWKIRNIVDEKAQERFYGNRFLAVIFWQLGLLPFLGAFIRKLWGRNDFRQHYRRMFSSLDYFLRAGRARIAETLIRWHRSGRINEERAQRLAQHSWRFFTHLPLSILPAKMHRFFSDRRFFVQSLDYIFVRPLRLYFKAEVRERWLKEIVTQGEKEGMLSGEEAAKIKSQIKEPFVQKYLKSLAVHICTLPVTQIVSVIIAVVYIKLHPELSWQAASVHAGLILGFFQVTPISPGSIARGLYVSFLVLKERNYKDYNIALPLSFLKYIGYLAFPIQMAYRYPSLARFMAGHWATGVVHIVPVFGERGALLEHAVFDIFYNYPLNIRRRLRQRSHLRAGLKTRYWPVAVGVLAGIFLLALMDVIHFQVIGFVPRFGDIWWVALLIPIFMAGAVSFWAGGAAVSKRILGGALCGALIGFFYPGMEAALSVFLTKGLNNGAIPFQFLSKMALIGLWRAFIFAIVAFIGAFAVEVRPLKKSRLSPLDKQ